MNDPTKRPRERQNIDVERDTGTDQPIPQDDGETERTIGPDDQDARLRPGEDRSTDTNP